MYEVKFDMGEFLKGKTVIWCKTENQAIWLLRNLEARGFSWDGDKSITNDNKWRFDKEETCYRCYNPVTRTLTQNDRFYYSVQCQYDLVRCDQLEEFPPIGTK